jgi:hypothetical protein
MKPFHQKATGLDIVGLYIIVLVVYICYFLMMSLYFILLVFDSTFIIVLGLPI